MNLHPLFPLFFALFFLTMESASEDETAALSVKNFNTDTAFCGFSCNQHSNPSSKCDDSCFQICPDVCKIVFVDNDPISESPPPSSLPTVPSDIGTPMVPKSDHPSQKDLITITMTIMGCMIGALLLFCILWKLFTDYRSRRRNSRRMRGAQMSFDTQGDLFDEYQGPFIDHPIWYINTIGLEQSVIDSIAIFKYKKDEGLIEGTECSVCLNVFQDDESLRLLPKCSHAFHVSCIDTWLRSHQNCPLCRAPIASDNIDAQISSSVATTSDLSPTEEPQMENSVNNSGGNICNQAGEDETSQVRNGDSNICQLPIEFNETIAGNSRMNTTDPSILRNQPRVQCDLVGNIQAVEAKMEPKRSSVSLDFSSASASYDAVGYNFSVKHQEDLDTKLEGLKHSKLKKVANRGSSGNSSFHKLIRSSSIGLSLQRGPLSMKRSLSYGRKWSSSRHSRSQDSILPL